MCVAFRSVQCTTNRATRFSRFLHKAHPHCKTLGVMAFNSRKLMFVLRIFQPPFLSGVFFFSRISGVRVFLYILKASKSFELIFRDVRKTDKMLLVICWTFSGVFECIIEMVPIYQNCEVGALYFPLRTNFLKTIFAVVFCRQATSTEYAVLGCLTTWMWG